MQPFSTAKTCPFLLVASIALSGCGGGGGGGALAIAAAPAAQVLASTTVVGGQPTSLSITSGAFKGTAISVPADALSAGTVVSFLAANDASSTADAVGPAVEIDIGGDTLTANATVTVPFSTAAIASGKTTADVIVLKQDGATVVELSQLDATPASLSGLTISVSVAALSVFQAAVDPAAQAIVPTITSIDRTTGPTLGGTFVTITGTGFIPGTDVRFGIDSTGVDEFLVAPQLVSSTTLTGFVPEILIDGVTVDVNVQHVGGLRFISDAFTYVKFPQQNALEPDYFNAAQSITPRALAADQHTFLVPARPNIDFNFSFDTTPSGSSVRLLVLQTSVDNTSLNPTPPESTVAVIDSTVTTPFATTLSSGATSEGQFAIVMAEPNGVSLNLNSLIVEAATQPFDSTKFQVVVHLAGDDFTGLGFNNDLVTLGDKADLVFQDIIPELNLLYTTQNAGIQVDAATSALDAHSNAFVKAQSLELFDDSTLLVEVINGIERTVLNTTSKGLWGFLGMPADNPNFGNALDVFLVHSVGTGQGGLAGTCDCLVGPISPDDDDHVDDTQTIGGIFKGKGPNHALIVPFFRNNGTPFSKDTMLKVLIHELGHFLSLRHTTELKGFDVDNLEGTPESEDTNQSGKLDLGDFIPDFNNVMFPIVQGDKLEQDQIDAMRGFLSISEH